MRVFESYELFLLGIAVAAARLDRPGVAAPVFLPELRALEAAGLITHSGASYSLTSTGWMAVDIWRADAQRGIST